MGYQRQYSTRRQAIVEALVNELKKIDGTGEYLSDVDEQVYPRLLFWDEVNEFPSIHLNAGTETREYQGGGYRDRFLSITARCYVQEENAAAALDKLLEDVETVLETNAQVYYNDKTGKRQKTYDIRIVSIETDEGVLEPLGVGEILFTVQY